MVNWFRFLVLASTLLIQNSGHSQPKISTKRMDVHRFANINSLKNIYSDRIPRSMSTTAIQVNVIVHLCLCYLWEIEYSLLHKNE